MSSLVNLIASGISLSARFKPLTESPLFFYGSSSYGVIFYSRRNIQKYVKPVQTAASHCYLLFWETEWKEIENRDSFDIELVSESVDKEIPWRGYLLLVKLKGADAAG